MERLNKYLAHAGVGSRRHCDKLIAAGRVKVNGVKVTELGLKVDPATHQIAVDDQPVKAEKLVYWAVNKPVGHLCTNHDPAGRPRAVDLLPHVEQRVYTVGRLDEGSEGLLLMTNDGDLAMGLTHPRYGVPKMYFVLVAGRPTDEDLKKLTDGVWLSDGKVRAKSVKRVKSQGHGTWVRVVLTEGKNREIRRMLAKLGHKVMRLKRTAIGPVKLDKLPKGKARRINEEELKLLKEFVGRAREKIAAARLRAAEGRGQKTERGAQNTDNRTQNTDNRTQNTDNRAQNTARGEQKTERGAQNTDNRAPRPAGKRPEAQGRKRRPEDKKP